ncbi:hypothetical protein MKX01_007358 [Papaver californicum]|nr:hypothetical protein MKX01_007358 [Papaver californicum]
MPDLPAYHDGCAKLQNYQYLWMAHWMGKSCHSVLQIYNEDGAGTDVGQASVTSMNMGCESNLRSEWYPFPLSSYNQNIDSFSTVREEHVTNSHTSHDTRNSSHGVASFPSIKDLYVCKNSITTCATFGSSREVGSRKTETVLPNICEDTPDIMTARGLTGKRSASRTDSLENLFSRVQPPMEVNPSEEVYVPEAQPNRRLVKHLKLNTCDSLAEGTRTSVGECASSE